MTKRLITCAFLGIILIIPTAHGETDPYKSQRRIVGPNNDVLVDVPIYDPHSKSYFKFVYTAGAKRGDYGALLVFARSQFFKGVRGRLAVIRSRETQDLINKVLRPPPETWIGLRMNCRGRKLYWVTGEKFDRKKDYTNWGQEWKYRDKYLICQPGYAHIDSRKYAGIALVNYRGVNRWWAIAPGHFTFKAIIEFPTGKP